MLVKEDLPALVLRGVAVRARGIAGAAPGARRPLRRDGEGGEVGPPLRVRIRVFDGRHVQRGQVRAHAFFTQFGKLLPIKVTKLFRAEELVQYKGMAKFLLAQ